MKSLISVFCLMALFAVSVFSEPRQSALPPLRQSALPKDCGCSITGDCNCKNCDCPNPVIKKVAKMSYRAAAGHTHTCPRCGNVWDHQSNPGHNCQNCGTAQYVQDYQPKAVPVYQQPAATVQTQSAYAQPVSTEGCASGGWGTNSGFRSGVFANRPILGGIFRR